MKISSKIDLNLEDKSSVDFYYSLLKEEDFNFKNKDISVLFEKKKSSLSVEVLANSVMDLKIGMNSLIKSLEVIDKVLLV